MYRLSRNIALLSFLLLYAAVYAQGVSTHGEGFKIDCKQCHTSDSWSIEVVNWNHDTTGFVLDGKHADVACGDCHQSLAFNEQTGECAQCHAPVHQGTVGNDCKRCHTTNHWLISDVQVLHEQAGFPLEGMHLLADCSQCHGTQREFVFEPMGQQCVDCHREDYEATTDPNHYALNFSMNCIECHDPFSVRWGGGNFHHFFPLEGGHNGVDCAQCHTTGNYTDATPECSSCHMDDFNAAVNPNHNGAGYSTDCTECHSTEPGWTISKFDLHDALHFPIYSGRHRVVWNDCATCHITPGNFDTFTCIDCHEHNDEAEVTDDHDDEDDFTYTPTSCYDCHPTGEE